MDESLSLSERLARALEDEAAGQSSRPVSLRLGDMEQQVNARRLSDKEGLGSAVKRSLELFFETREALVAELRLTRKEAAFLRLACPKDRGWPKKAKFFRAMVEIWFDELDWLDQHEHRSDVEMLLAKLSKYTPAQVLVLADMLELAMTPRPWLKGPEVLFKDRDFLTPQDTEALKASGVEDVADWMDPFPEGELFDSLRGSEDGAR